MVEALCVPARYLQLAYQRHLPVLDFMGAATVRHLTPEVVARLQPPWPAVIVAAGRRTAPVARWIARQSGGSTRTVQLMRPGSLRGLDLVAMPRHDRPADRPDVIATLGAPHPFTRAVIDAAVADLPATARRLPRPWLTVLVGGPGAGARYDDDEIARFAGALDALAAELGAGLMVTTSRRTTPALAAALDRLKAPAQVHHVGAGGRNPLRAFLGVADRVVVTADSASMLSEAAATGRPVHAFLPQGLKPKLRSLAEALAAAGHVVPWQVDVPAPAAPLDEAARVAAAIRARWSLVLGPRACLSC